MEILDSSTDPSSLQKRNTVPALPSFRRRSSPGDSSGSPSSPTRRDRLGSPFKSSGVKWKDLESSGHSGVPPRKAQSRWGELFLFCVNVSLYIFVYSLSSNSYLSLCLCVSLCVISLAFTTLSRLLLVGFWRNLVEILKLRSDWLF